MKNYDLNGMLKNAEDDIEFTLKLKISRDSCNTIIRNIYEAFRMLGEAVLLSKGFKSFDHKAMIEELLKLDKNEHLLFLNTIKEIRHKINHKGYQAGIEETKDIIDFAEQHFNNIFKKVKNEIDNFSI